MIQGLHLNNMYSVSDDFFEWMKMKTVNCL